MSARLTIEAKDFEKKLELLTDFGKKLPEVKNNIVYQSFTINKKVTPKGATGNLQDSFFFEVPGEDSLVFGWKAEYAKFVDQGAPPSPGRYVPGMPCAKGEGRRLTMKPIEVKGLSEPGMKELLKTHEGHITQVHGLFTKHRTTYDVALERHTLPSRKQVYREALDRGIPEHIAKVALGIPMTHVQRRSLGQSETGGPTWGEFTPGIMSYNEFQTFEDATGNPSTVMKVRKSTKLSPEQKHAILQNLEGGLKRAMRKEGSIKVATAGQSLRHIKETERHELGHAVDWAQGKEFEHETEYANRPQEVSARMWEMSAGLHHKDIGMHPGQKGQHFVEKFMTEMRTVAVQETCKTLHEVLAS